MEKEIIINARKYDNRIHRSWSCQLVEKSETLLTFVGEFPEQIIHPDLGVIRPKTVSYEFYWLNRCYNVFRFHEPEGELRNFYCNINLPPKFSNSVLDYIDLDIDVLIWKNFEYKILDLDEFEFNANQFSYSPEIVEKAKSALHELLELIETRSFPFDFVEPKL